jgi:hypothetical protein
MRSSAAPTATVLVVVTLVFAPILKHNRWIPMLVGGSTTRVEVQCDSKAKCPPVAAIVEKVDAADSSQGSIDAANAKAVQQAIADYLARSGR